MRTRKERPENPKTIDFVGEDQGVEIAGKDGKGFFACYLLTSISPRHKGHTYIGFTVNPRRRIRQHNGEIRSGAWRTKSRRPWEMVLCIYGFPTNVSALQFEWAWQHPTESLAVRQAAAAFKSFSGVASKTKLAYTMLNLPAWRSLNITVNYFSTKYTNHGALCPSLPEHMKVRICSMDELPCCTKGDASLSENEDSLHGEEQEEENEGGDPSMPGNRSDASNNSLANDLSTVDESLTELPSIIDDSLPKVNTFFVEESTEDADLSGFSACNHTTEVEKQRGTEFSAGLNVDDEVQLPRNEAFAAKDGSRNCYRKSNEVEVIDLLSPSPSCRVGSWSKKRRVAEIIDLTRSPNFIQL